MNIVRLAVYDIRNFSGNVKIRHHASAEQAAAYYYAAIGIITYSKLELHVTKDHVMTVIVRDDVAGQ